MVKKAQINPTESNSRNFPTKDFSKTISLAGWEQQVFGCRAGRGTGGQGGQGGQGDRRPLWVIYSSIPKSPCQNEDGGGHRMAAETQRCSPSRNSHPAWWTCSIMGSKLNHFIVWGKSVRFSSQPTLLWRWGKMAQGEGCAPHLRAQHRAGDGWQNSAAAPDTLHSHRALINK